MNRERKVIRIIKDYKFDNNLPFVIDQINKLYQKNISEKLIKSIMSEIDYYLYVLDYLDGYNKTKCLLFKHCYELIKKLNFKDNLDLAIIFSLILQKNIFQLYNNLKSNHTLIPGLEFLNIINGSNVCLDNSLTLSNFFNANGINSSVLIGQLNCVDNNIDDLGYITGDHAITMFEDNSNIQLFDATHLGLFELDNDKAYIINGSGYLNICYMQSFLLQANSLLINDYHQEILTNDEIITKIINIIDLLNNDFLNLIRNESLEYLEELNNQGNNIKRLIR